MSGLQKIMLLIAAVMLGITLYMASNTLSYINSSVQSVGKVVDYREVFSSHSITYAPVIEYKLPSGEMGHFVSSTSAYPPAYDVGEPVDILYSKSQPLDASINGFFSLWLGELIVGGIGVLFLGIALFGPIMTFFSQRKRATLTLKGVRIDTKFMGVERNWNLRVNGRHPYKIVTQGINSYTNQRQRFESQNLWQDPTPYLGERWITVYVDKKRPKRYFMDIDFLYR